MDQVGGDGDNGHYRAYHYTNHSGNHNHGFRTNWMDRNNVHNHAITINPTGLGHAFDVKPNFYKLIFIMKL